MWIKYYEAESKTEYEVETNYITSYVDMQDSIFRGESNANHFEEFKRSYSVIPLGKNMCTDNHTKYSILQANNSKPATRNKYRRVLLRVFLQQYRTCLQTVNQPPWNHSQIRFRSSGISYLQPNLATSDKNKIIPVKSNLRGRRFPTGIDLQQVVRNCFLNQLR